MNNYIPFLKLKGSEISALKHLHSTHPHINPEPFFDFPRKKLKNQGVNLKPLLRTKRNCLLRI